MDYAYAIPSPGRREGGNWVLDTIPLMPGGDEALSRRNARDERDLGSGAGRRSVIEALVEAIEVYQRRHDVRRGVGSTPARSAP